NSSFTETMFPDQSDFEYDYDTLRTTGVILAVIMFVSGILICVLKTHVLPLKFPFPQRKVHLRLHKYV
uniref:FXYD domain-containing ion transport regulator n=1 Tax=Amphilophus citrinellus TaxID=61819 RepID=A0A3Q0STD3_AMPCI